MEKDWDASLLYSEIHVLPTRAIAEESELGPPVKGLVPVWEPSGGRPTLALLMTVVTTPNRSTVALDKSQVRIMIAINEEERDIV